jgi:F-type H+-transporting ATPase subunit a
VSAEGHHSPLDQFAVSPVFELPKLFGIDASITNSSAVMIASVLLVLIVFAYAMRRRAVVPGRMQSLAELSYMFVRDTVGENAGHAGLRYAPFIFTLFLFILAMNLLGLVPKSFAPTSHIIITFGMGAFVFSRNHTCWADQKRPHRLFQTFHSIGYPSFYCADDFSD